MIREDGSRVSFSWLTAANVATAIANSGAALFATRVLGPKDRGVMVLGITIAGIVALIVSLGAGPVLRSRLPRANPDVRRVLINTYAWVSVGGAVVGGFLTALLVYLLSFTIDSSLSSAGFVVAAGVFCSGQVAIHQLADRWFADGKFKSGSLWTLGGTLLGLSGIVAASALLPQGWLFLLLQGGGLLAVGVVETIFLARAGMATFRQCDSADIRDFVGTGWHALGMNLGLAIALRSDRYILGVVAGPAAVGIYSLAATLAEVPKLFSSAIGQLFQGAVAKDASGSDVSTVVARSLLSTIAISVVIGCAGWFLIVPVLGAEFAPARPLLILLLLAETCLSPYVVLSSGILGGGWTTAAGWIGLAGSVSAVAIYYLTISAWQMTGACVGSAILYVFLSLLTWFVLRNRLNSRIFVDQSKAVNASTTEHSQALVEAQGLVQR